MNLGNNDLDYDEFGLPKCTVCSARMILPVSPRWENVSDVQAECPNCAAVLVKSEVIKGSTLLHQPDEMVVDVNEAGDVIDPSKPRTKKWEPWNISTKKNLKALSKEMLKEKPFSTRSEKELEEILTGLGLLWEYSDVSPYLEPLFNDVTAALANRLRGSRA